MLHIAYCGILKAYYLLLAALAAVLALVAATAAAPLIAESFLR